MALRNNKKYVNYKKSNNILKKKLTRSKNGMLLGVCGGIAEWLELDPTVVRIVYMIITVLTGFFPLSIAYIVAALIMPYSENELN